MYAKWILLWLHICESSKSKMTLWLTCTILGNKCRLRSACTYIQSESESTLLAHSIIKFHTLIMLMKQLACAGWFESMLIANAVMLFSRWRDISNLRLHTIFTLSIQTSLYHTWPKFEQMFYTICWCVLKNCWIGGKQCRPWSDAAKCCVGFGLHCLLGIVSLN